MDVPSDGAQWLGPLGSWEETGSHGHQANLRDWQPIPKGLKASLLDHQGNLPDQQIIHPGHSDPSPGSQLHLCEQANVRLSSPQPALPSAVGSL